MSLCTLARPHSQTANEHQEYTWGGCAAIVAACLVVELVGRVVVAKAWSTFDFPDWVTGPVMTAVYAAMAVSASLVWLARDRDDVCCPLTTFVVQLAAGLCWPVLLFGIGNPVLGMIGLLVMWFTLGLTLVQFFGVSRLAGGLLVPCWAWVSYATLLSGSAVFAML